ncbi:MAG: Threonine/homoserine efflux transporter RhtA [Mucilaginibacter sp.]|nr:Threonine/homoserine efflux transporter RhtA [Mucilaginibacter sp.]
MKKALILLHLSVFLAGFTGIFGKLISLNAGLISWYRLFLSGLMLLLILAVSGKLKKISFKDVLRIAFAGSLLGLHWIFFYASIKYANISVGVVCFSLGSFFTALLEPLINRRKFSVGELLLSGLILCGIALIFGLDATYRTGIIMGVISAILVALYTIFNKRLTKSFNSSTITLYTMLGGCAGVTIVMPLYLHFSPVATFIPSLPDFGYLLLLSLVCTVLMYSMITTALQKISAFTVNLAFNLEPLYSIILAIIFFKENRELSVGFYAGLSLIVFSVVLQMFRVALEQKRLVPSQ